MVRTKRILLAAHGNSDSCRKEVKSHINCPGIIPLLGLDGEYLELFNLIMRTVDRAESNSALIIGARGSGKSSLVHNVLEDIEKSHKTFKDNTIVVSLNGYVHTDDRLSLKGITGQMQLENCVGDKVFGSFAENLNFLLQCLRTGTQKTSKSVIFILDEFDLFCAHRNQTLLYNLFDIAQSAQAPICVLGLTCRNDVTELLEKRVMSRFSNRQIYIHPSAEESENETFQRRMNSMRNILSVQNTEGYPFRTEWNKSIEELCANSEVKKCIRDMLDMTACENTFRNLLFLVISKVCDSHPFPMADDFVECTKMMNCNVRVKTIEGLCVMELCLVIAMKHETEIHDGNPFNFEMILRRYLKFAHFHPMLQVDRQVILKSFENLKRMELIQPVSAGTGQILREFQLFNLLVNPDEVREAVNNYVGAPTEVQQWAMSDLT